MTDEFARGEKTRWPVSAGKVYIKKKTKKDGKVFLPSKTKKKTRKSFRGGIYYPDSGKPASRKWKEQETHSFC